MIVQVEYESRNPNILGMFFAVAGTKQVTLRTGGLLVRIQDRDKAELRKAIRRSPEYGNETINGVRYRWGVDHSASRAEADAAVEAARWIK